MSKVEVLCPNGHRVSVKVNPNTKVLQIQEEVCAKQGFQPVLDYELKHGRRTLDVVLSVQYAAIPNLAKLELVKSAQSRAETPVFIAIQPMNGPRMAREFMPATSLWSILESFEQDDGGGGKAKLVCSHDKSEYPVCLYLKDEVVGEHALRETTLRQLGLTSGRAIMRHYFKAVTNEELQAINSRVDAELKRLAKLANTAAAAAAANSTSTPADQQHDSCSATADPQHDICSANIIQLRPSEVPSPEDLSADARMNVDFSRTDVTEGDNAFQASNVQTSHYQRQAFPDILPEYSNRSQFSPPLPPMYERPQSAFADFKFPEDTKGKDVYRNELSDFKKEDCQACDRQTTVYHINEAADESIVKGAEDVPDEFFNVTETDIRILYADQQRKVNEHNEQTLMTQSMRRMEREARLSRYSYAIIRVQFPDGVVVQGVFRPRETVFALYKFVREMLADKQHQFELYSSPPKVSLHDNTATLLEANLVPMALIYFGLPFKCDQYLSDETICQLARKRLADEIVIKHLPTSSNTGDAAASGRRTTSDHPASSQASGSLGNVPKWFKIGK